MRIRRRTSPFPEETMIQAWYKNISKYLKNISNARNVIGEVSVNNYAINVDIKGYEKTEGVFDAAITSPPYATALPYIDTQRISLVWLGLCKPEEIMQLESTLIGSREIISNEKAGWENRKTENSDELPLEIYSLITDIEGSLSPKDGFRKKAMPILLYRYFVEMKQMFINVSNKIVQGGKFALVVGHNKTTVGDVAYQIDTPHLLASLATYCGWNIIELVPLQTYKRYGINSKNAINKETLIILENQ
jgi:site-specific DNA-methyltransferase (cytosine-N4-specific)